MQTYTSISKWTNNVPQLRSKAVPQCIDCTLATLPDNFYMHYHVFSFRVREYCCTFKCNDGRSNGLLNLRAV